MTHIYQSHSHGRNFFVTCGIDGCPATYQRYHSFYKHVKSLHSHLYDDTTGNNVIDVGLSHLDYVENSTLQAHDRFEPATSPRLVQSDNTPDGLAGDEPSSPIQGYDLQVCMHAFVMCIYT